ncbi:MAG TPA: 3-isopropylmalate dehydratase small subunit [Steroidobacteraceae bacterium]|nr:3-isopropylmalate dehydratase small subunit [Steroidobacteraceae bacterium]
MERFNSLRAVALPIAQPNFDTDQILPARFLQKPRAQNFSEFLFRDLRQRRDGTENPDFVLNKPAYRAARIVLAEANFGCGSSREHAVWALYDYGIRAVIAPSMGDIFVSNAAKNGLLTIALPETVVAGMMEAVLAEPGLQMEVDLEAQSVTVKGARYGFEIDPYRKRCLLSGLDELGYTLTQLDKIEAFERDYR